MRAIRSYTDLSKLETFNERYEYLCLNGKVGESTFGYDRYLNQQVYKDPRWKTARDKVIIRDNGCDLGIPTMEIYDQITIHHMNPLTPEDIENDRPEIYDPEYLISTTENTHTAIHLGNRNLLPRIPVPRRKNDTCPWKK